MVLAANDLMEMRPVTVFAGARHGIGHLALTAGLPLDDCLLVLQNDRV